MRSKAVGAWVSPAEPADETNPRDLRGVKKICDGESCSMSEKFELRLSLSRKNVIASVLVLAVSAGIFAMEWQLAFLQEARDQSAVCWWYIFSFGVMTALSAGLCLVETEIPPGPGEKLGWLLVFVLPLWAFITVDVINGTKIWQFPQKRWLANYLCYLLVFLLGYALTRRAWGAAAIGGAVAITFGIANYFVVQFRGQPILPWDFTSFSTALTVSGGYEYIPTRKMALAVISYLCIVTACVKLSPRRAGAARRVWRRERLAALGLSGALLFLLFPLNGLSNMGITVWAWNQKASSELTGIAAGFFANVQFMLVDKPDGYSRARVERLASLREAQEPEAFLGEPGEKPTVIAVMNESMTDFGSFESVGFLPDNQPFLHSLQRSGDCVWGQAYSSVYGGNTCNSEYEFLTGNSMAFLPNGSKPYQQYIDSPQSSLPALLKEQGYHCTAIHPGDREAWQRIEAYPHLGFDEFVDATIFDVERHFEHRLTSDRSCYEQVIYEYERWRGISEDPLFLFNVTIQNHGGYEDENYKTRVRVQDAAGKWPKAEQYLTLTKSSDQALEYLLDYFSARPDPVVILFFGDHWPKLEDGFNKAVLAGESGFGATMSQYRVPFFLWANYPLKTQEIPAVSLNYLSGLLLSAAGLPGSGYTDYLEDLRQQIPVITAIGCMDKDGRLYRTGEKTPYDKLLQEYAVLQYNNAFDEDGKVERMFCRRET